MRLISVVLSCCLTFIIPLAVCAGEGQGDAGKKTAGDRSDGKYKRPKSALTDEQLWDIYYETLAKLKPHGIPVDREEHKRKIKPEFLGWAAPNDSLMVGYCVVFGTEDISLQIEANTGEVRLYSFESGPPRVRPNQRPSGAKSKLTPAQVKEIAQKYLFLNTRIPLKEYEITVKYDLCFWYIKLQRTLGGHPFEYDAIHMFYSETRGLLMYKNCIFSGECDVDEKVTEEAAWTVADKYVEAIMKELEETGLEAVMGRGNKPDEHLLKIVNPVFAAKHIGRPWLDADITLEKARKTRLAWVFVYWSKSGDRVLMYVYIDAINGKPLGYHYMSDEEC